jgi:hypothetical protein
VADYVATVESAWSRDRTFDYMADFRNVAEWDPSMERAELLSGEAGSAGAKYRLTMTVLGVATDLEYEAVEVSRPERIVMQSALNGAVSTDTIRVDDGKVTYHANIDLEGVRKVANPVVDLVLQRLGERAKQGLSEKLSTL